MRPTLAVAAKAKIGLIVHRFGLLWRFQWWPWQVIFSWILSVNF